MFSSIDAQLYIENKVNKNNLNVIDSAVFRETNKYEPGKYAVEAIIHAKDVWEDYVPIEKSGYKPKTYNDKIAVVDYFDCNGLPVCFSLFDEIIALATNSTKLSLDGNFVEGVGCRLPQIATQVRSTGEEKVRIDLYFKHFTITVAAHSNFYKVFDKEYNPCKYWGWYWGSEHELLRQLLYLNAVTGFLKGISVDKGYFVIKDNTLVKYEGP